MNKRTAKFQNDLKKFTCILEKEGKNLLKQIKTSSSAITNTLKSTDTSKEIEKAITTNYKKIEPTVKEYASILQKEVKKLGTIFNDWKETYQKTKASAKAKITKKYSSKCSSKGSCKCSGTTRKTKPKTSSRSSR